MKSASICLHIIMLLFICLSCDNLQKNIEDRAKDIKETANKEIDRKLSEVDSAINQIDTSIQKKIDDQLIKADSLMNQIEEKILK